nr:uncharacterized protein LOC104104078 [Nicotiana tomentosiformis]
MKAALNKAYPNCELKLPWDRLCDTLFKLHPKKSLMVVQWQKPELGYFKLNTDGRFKKSDGSTGLEGALRRDNGEIIMAFSFPYRCNNHNLAEAYAAYLGITWCIQNGYTDFTLEMDSLLLVDMLRGEKESNYRMAKITEKIAQLRRTANINIHHCYREANQQADCLAKMASKAQNGAFFFSGQQLRAPNTWTKAKFKH